jgi:hypothetical protein
MRLSEMLMVVALPIRSDQAHLHPIDEPLLGF